MTDRSVAALLRSLRVDHPNSMISAELTRLDETQAVVRVEIVLPEGGSASSYGVAAADTPHAVETAENRALGRALSALGYLESGEPAPSDHKERGPSPLEPMIDERPARSEATEAPRTTDDQVPPAPIETVAPQPTADEGDPPLEDYSWTAFWKWARKAGYQDKATVEELIGESITSLSPAQVRDALREKTGIE